ncbi:MAG: hypothetical protein ACRD68_17440, partial [Pyrinomonadaceae bacterium]
IQEHAYYSYFYSSPTHRFFRLRHDSSTDTLIWETSPDGSAWTTRHTMARPISLTAVRVELVAGSDGAITTQAPGKAIFDNFQLTTQ